MKVIAVVVTYNRKALLLECIHSILKQSYPVDEIVILDNASTDGTSDSLQQAGILANPIVRYVVKETNTGGAGGFYYGSKQAFDDGADWIWMMDDDCFPNPTALEALVEASKTVDPGFLCSMVFNRDGDPCNLPSVSFGPRFTYLDQGLVEVSRATFVSYFIPRASVECCGLPYKEFFIWGDDDEYSFRLTKYYKPGYMVGKSKVIHYVGKSTSPWDSAEPKRIKMAHYLIRNTLLNSKEYDSVNGKIKLRIGHFRLVLRIIFSHRKKKLLKLGQIFCGYWEFYRNI